MTGYTTLICFSGDNVILSKAGMWFSRKIETVYLAAINFIYTQTVYLLYDQFNAIFSFKLLKNSPTTLKYCILPLYITIHPFNDRFRCNESTNVVWTTSHISFEFLSMAEFQSTKNYV